MNDLIKRWLDSAAKKNWFKHIDKQLRRVEHAEWDLYTQKYVLKALVDKYNDIYGTKLDFPDLIGDVEEDDEDEN